jgi:molybdopterin converting factor small subunit
MSKITVRIPMPLRPFVDDATVMDADANTVGAALEQIGAHHPGFLQRVILNDGELRPYVNVFIGVDDVRSHSGLKTPLRDGDVVSIISAVAGG